jgi:hypothetical protein
MDPVKRTRTDPEGEGGRWLGRDRRSRRRVWTPGPTASGSYHTGTSFAVPFVVVAIAARPADGATLSASCQLTCWQGRSTAGPSH